MVASLWPVPLGTEFVRIFFRPADWQSIHLYLERDRCQPCVSDLWGRNLHGESPNGWAVGEKSRLREWRIPQAAGRQLTKGRMFTFLGARLSLTSPRSAGRGRRIGDGVLGKRRAVAVEGITRRVWFIRVCAQLATIISLLIIDPWRIGGERIRRRLIAERTAVGTKRIVDAVKFEGASSSKGISRRVRIKRIGAQIAEIFGGCGERTQQEEQKRYPVLLRNDGLTCRLLPAREHCKRSMMSAPGIVC